MAESERIRAKPSRARQVQAWRVGSPTEDVLPLRRFYLESVRPFLRGDGAHRTAERCRGGRTDAGGSVQDPAADAHEAARDLADVAAERRDLAVQRRLHLWLHGWLMVHVPLTAALLVLLAAHSGAPRSATSF